MPADRDLNLNSLSRFTKASPRLHLEEHGHCEVPAGCGGVVLRWYNPAKGLPVLLRVRTACPGRFFLNGVALTSARPLVPPGEAVLTIEFDAAARGPALVSFAAVLSPDGTFDADQNPRILARSEPDGSWRYSTDAPPEGSMLPTFDAGGWPSLEEIPFEPPKPDDWHGKDVAKKLSELGARPLGIPRAKPGGGWLQNLLASRPAGGATGKVWVRKVFTVPPEGAP